MRLVKGADIYSSGGQKLGTLERVVIDPETKEVTHLVVARGALLKTHKVIAMDMFNRDVEDNITLLNPYQDLDEFQDFKETHYVNLDLTDAPTTDVEVSYWYPPLEMAWWRAGGTDNPVYHPSMPPIMAKTTQAIPEGTVALAEGARVVSSDDKHVGNVEQVIVDPQDHRVSHFVVKEGVLFKERKLIPVLWISNIDQNEVRLSTNSRVLERLPGYQTST